MVQGINSQSNIYALKDLVNLAKYATGVPLTNDANKLTIGQVAQYPATLCAYDGYQWVKNNKGQYKEAFKQVCENGKAAHDILKNHGAKGVLRVADAKEVLANIPSAEGLSSLSANAQNLYKQAQTLAEKAIANPKSVEDLKNASSTLAKAQATAHAELAKNPNWFGKFKNAVGITKVEQASKNLSAKSPVYKKCKDAYDNESGTFMLVIQGGVEAFANVIPTFKQLGFKRGMKQLGRSTAKVVCSVAGWVAGSALGTKAGELLGAAVGNSKAGAVVAAVAGKVSSYAVGTIAQHYTERGVEKVLGKSELEKAKEEEAIKIAELAQTDPEVFDALVEQAAQRLAMEGEDTAESKAVNATLRNLVEQKEAASKSTSQMMTREEMKAYADKLADNTVTNPVKANNNGYTGYIPSAAAAPIKPEVQQVAVENNNKPAEEMSDDMKALLAKTDRMIKNGSRYLNLK